MVPSSDPNPSDHPVVDGGATRSPSSSISDSEVLRLCWDEYKLLQDKIDKIGTFKFQIKGWAVTIVSGFIVGSYAASAPVYVFLLLPFVVVMFWLLEENQSIRGWRYGSLARSLETKVGRMLSTSGKHHPRICGTSLLPRSLRAATRPDGLLALLAGVKAGRLGFWCIRHSTNLFYCSLLLVTILVVALRVIEPPRRSTPKSPMSASVQTREPDLVVHVVGAAGPPAPAGVQGGRGPQEPPGPQGPLGPQGPPASVDATQLGVDKIQPEAP